MLQETPYIWDSLYGPIRLPGFVWEIVPSPELQRLREVRLCNINSLCLTGGANINRYEHAIGTCYLAMECLDSWAPLSPVSPSEYRYFLLAALLHDIASAAFGHSVEYIESRAGFAHEKGFLHVVLGRTDEGSYAYKSTTFEPIFFGMARSILSRANETDLLRIGEIVAGKGRLGPLISSALDLDNIDNVVRLSYHLGLTRSGDLAVQLARSIWVEENQLVVKPECGHLIEEWQQIRKKLYLLLLLNPQEFAAKCMLTEAIEIAKSRQSQPFKWYDVDFELLKELAEVSAETKSIIQRLMRGDLYGCLGIYATEKTGMQEFFADPRTRALLETSMGNSIRARFGGKFKSALVAIHCIADINKTDREVRVRLGTGQTVTIGKRSNQLLIGVFLKNTGMSMYQVDKMQEIDELRAEVLALLARKLEDNHIREVELYAESDQCQW